MRNDVHTIDNNTKYFNEKLNSHRVFFLTGAGISIDSNMPSVQKLLSKTIEIFLPSYSLETTKFSDNEVLSKKLKDLINSNDTQLQPEMFYGTLLRFFNDRRNNLKLWSCLLESHQDSLGIKIYPNVAHYFLVYYSVMAGVPLLTMNYDTLFEKAFKELKNMGLICGHIQIYTPDNQPPSLDNKFSGLVLCKLHGTIEDEEGNFNYLSIKTTMSEITKITPEWSDFIRKLCISLFPCFAGYSGRDIDYFPIFKSIYNKESNINTNLFWVDKFDSSCSTSLQRKVKETKAVKIDGYFNEVLQKIRKLFGNQVIPICFYLSNLKNRDSSVDKLLIPIISDMKKDIKVSKIVETVFLLTLLVNHGDNSDIVFNNIKKELSSRSIRGHSIYSSLLTLYIRLNRERGDFIEYRNSSIKLQQITNKRLDFPTYLYAETEIVSSYQMEIPNFEDYHPILSDYLLFIATFIRMLKLIFKYQNIEYNSTFEEFKIRTLALMLKIPILKHSVKYFIYKIRSKAQTQGNFATLVSCDKYLSRISKHSEELRHGTIDAAKTIGDFSAEQIVLRDANLTEEALQIAKSSGNNLNTLKTIIKKARKNSNCLSRDEMTLFENCEGKINSISLRRALARIKSELKVQDDNKRFDIEMDK